MDVFEPAECSRVMGLIPGKNTSPELAVRRILHRLGFRFRIHRRELPGCPDVVLPGHRIALFVHGCFWHDHQGCRFATKPKTNEAFWLDKFARTRARDAAAIQALKSQGWRPLTIWECELRDLGKLIEKLDALRA